MKKMVLITSSALVLAMGLSSAALAHGDHGGKRGPGGKGMGGEMMFEMFDVNGDGKITAEEIEEAKAKRFAEADTDGDGLLSAEELSAAAEEKANERMAKRQARMIEKLDEDGDGKLSAEEMDARGPGDKMFERMLKRLDADEDGAISKEELEAAQDRRGGKGDKGGKGGHRGGHAPWWMR